MSYPHLPVKSHICSVYSEISRKKNACLYAHRWLSLLHLGIKLECPISIPYQSMVTPACVFLSKILFFIGKT